MAYAYFVQYGKSAFVGRFLAEFDHNLVRGVRGVIRTSRGIELGTVLCEAHPPFANRDQDGSILRLASESDVLAYEQLECRGQELLLTARERAGASGLPLELVDVEMALDEQSAVLHGLPWDECDATEFFAELSHSFGLVVRLLDLSRLQSAKDEPTSSGGGCGKPDCGSGSCTSCSSGAGCSLGSCSRGKVSKAADLTSYFAELRQKMETGIPHRVPLV